MLALETSVMIAKKHVAGCDQKIRLFWVCEACYLVRQHAGRLTVTKSVLVRDDKAF